VNNAATEIYFAFRGRLASFRSIGHASVGDVIGHDVSHRPRTHALRDLTEALSPTVISVHSLRWFSILFAFYYNTFCFVPTS